MVGESGKEMEFGCRMGADGVGIDDGFGDAPDCSRIRDLMLAILEENCISPPRVSLPAR